MEKASIARTEKEGKGLKLRKEAVSAALSIAGEVIYHQERRRRSLCHLQQQVRLCLDPQLRQ